MTYSVPTLHSPVVKLQDQKSVAQQLSSIAAARQRSAAAVVRSQTTPSINISLTTVSLQGNFDAMVHLTYPGLNGPAIELLVDTGNSSLIVPRYSDIAGLPNFERDYSILAQNVAEPWQCPAHIIRGPIQIPMQGGGVYEIPDCVFYACTGANSKGELTANFGTGCITPWQSNGGIVMRSPLSSDANYPFAEFNYAPAQQLLTAISEPIVDDGSVLTLYKNVPSGYQMFDIKKDCLWMSLIPRSLSIGDTLTAWPGTIPSIAMIDTGGGPVFLSDPENYLYGHNWPDQTENPDWTSPDSISCQSTFDKITITIGDESGSFTYSVDTSVLPESVQGLTLVMCENCAYMMGNNGMNVGGLSALFNYVLVDYASARIGLKKKLPTSPGSPTA
jgi:hypothetical protein